VPQPTVPGMPADLYADRQHETLVNLRQKLKVIQDSQAAAYNKGRKEGEFLVGDRVWCHIEATTLGLPKARDREPCDDKLWPRWFGPCVVEKVDHPVYTVNDGSRVHRLHIEGLMDAVHNEEKKVGWIDPADLRK
jgi:hypothetical protein